MFVDPSRTSLAGFIREVAAAYPDEDAVVLADARITYAELLGAATRWSRRLATLGVQPGQHVGILLPNGTEFMCVLFDIAIAGAVAVPLNSRYRGQEIAATVADADLVTIITTSEAVGHPSFTNRLREAFADLPSQADSRRLALAGAPKLRNILILDDIAEAGFLSVAEVDIAANDADARPAEQDAVPADTAVILYTSGSTARPKGCLLSHTALLSQGQLMAARYEMTAADRIWSPVPMFHVGGISPFIAIASVGGAFLSMPRIVPEAGLALMAQERATISYVLFQTIITDLLHYPGFDQFDLGNVRLVISNLALQPGWIADLLAAKMPNAIQIGTFGLTETVGAACTHSPRDDEADRLRRLGRPLPGVQVRIVDESGAGVPDGAIGEVLLRGPTLSHGYYRDEQKTRETLAGGWLRTGDRGSLDSSGSIMFHGRLKDVLKVGGENVGALEVEAIVGEHPAVKGCAVVGMDDPRLVEVPVAFVELKPGAVATEEDILEFCEGKLASFKIPRRAFFVKEWPMSSTKIDKPALRGRIPEFLRATSGAVKA